MAAIFPQKGFFLFPKYRPLLGTERKKTGIVFIFQIKAIPAKVFGKCGSAIASATVEQGFCNKSVQVADTC